MLKKAIKPREQYAVVRSSKLPGRPARYLVEATGWSSSAEFAKRFPSKAKAQKKCRSPRDRVVGMNFYDDLSKTEVKP